MRRRKGRINCKFESNTSIIRFTWEHDQTTGGLGHLGRICINLGLWTCVLIQLGCRRYANMV